MSGFVGWSVELGLLRTRLQRIAESRRGIAVAIRGRRQVGKSRLVQEFRDPRRTGLVVVSLAGTEQSVAETVDLAWNASDVLSAWSCTKSSARR